MEFDRPWAETVCLARNTLPKLPIAISWPQMYDCAIVTLDSTQSSALLVQMHEDEKGGSGDKALCTVNYGISQGRIMFCSVLPSLHETSECNMVFAMVAALVPAVALGGNNGMAVRPPMSWRSW